MRSTWNWIKSLWTVSRRSASRRHAVNCQTLSAVLALLIAIGGSMSQAMAFEPVAAQAPASLRFPTIHPDHKHAQRMLENALLYIAPDSRTIDPFSGYPVEGWNHDPNNGFCLRSFTQLTAIGEWMEVLGNVIAGHIHTPHLSREQALAQLSQVVASLRHDQKDPQVSAKGLLGNFLDLTPGKRLGLLARDVEKQRFFDAFGPEKGEALWQSLKAKGWLMASADDREAIIHRGLQYGWNYFDGTLAAYGDDATKQKLMAILDERVVMVVFGDNANLSTSVAKTIGALLHPEIKGTPQVVQVRQEMERFLEDQQAGYAHLYDAKAGLFSFGWDATKDRLFGWQDAQGNWQAGHMDYLVNEFRGPAMFVVLQYNLPLDSLANLGFKMKPYRKQDGTDIYALAPWEGSTFQALGLGLSMLELDNPSWRKLLENVVDIGVDYAERNRLPGFLSESYTGNGTIYTGDVGIPDIAVSAMPRITEAASLYTLGVAYMVAPAKVEQFLAVNWPVMSNLLTDHGPWEGFNVAKQEVIQIQTTAHTLSLILGLVGTGSEHMQRYLEHKGLAERLAEIYRSGGTVDLLAEPTQVFAWADKQSALESSRDKTAFHVKGGPAHQVGIAMVPTSPEGVNLSGGLLTLRYRSSKPIDRATIGFKPVGHAESHSKLIPKEVFTRLADTKGQEAEIQMPLPATPGLAQIKEVVLTFNSQGRPVDLSVTQFGVVPIGDQVQVTSAR